MLTVEGCAPALIFCVFDIDCVISIVCMTTRVVLFVVCAISASIWQRFSGDCPALLIAVFVPRMCARCVYCSYSGAPSAAALGGDVWCRAALLAMCGANTSCLHIPPCCTTTLASCASTSGIPRASSNHGCHSGSATLHRRAPVVRLSLVQCRQHLAQPVTAHNTWSIRKQRP